MVLEVVFVNAGNPMVFRLAGKLVMSVADVAELTPVPAPEEVFKSSGF